MAITSKGHNSIEIKCHKYSVSTACQHFCDKVNVDIKSKYISKKKKNVSYQMHPYRQNDWFYEYFHSNYLGVALRCNWSYKYKINNIFNNPSYLNKRSELALRCRHRTKFLLIPPKEREEEV